MVYNSKIYLGVYDRDLMTFLIIRLKIIQIQLNL